MTPYSGLAADYPFTKYRGMLVRLQNGTHCVVVRGVVPDGAIVVVSDDDASLDGIPRMIDGAMEVAGAEQS